MKINFKFLTAIIFIMTIVATSCIKKEFDEPEIPNPCDANPGLNPNITIEKILELYNLDTFDILLGNVKTFPPEQNYVLEATVISSDKEGNFYKEIYLQDNTDALIISVDGTSLYNDYDVGQTVQIKLSGLNVELDDRTNSLVIGMGLFEGASLGRIPVSLIDKYMFRKSCPKDIEPIEIAIPDIPLNDSLFGRLVRINEVQFALTGFTYADGVNQITVNLNLEDTAFNTLILRTSGYAGFANSVVPDKSGYIIGVLSKYDDDYQLYIRDTNDVVFNNKRFGILYKNFEDGSLLSGGWTEKQVSGNIGWEIYSGGGVVCGSISNYDGNNNSACETWLISPVVDLSETVAPILSFSNAYSYTGPVLQTYISTDYDGSSDPSTATWTQLNFTLSSGYFAWASSGFIDISAYKQSNVHIAYVYTGTSSSGSTWEVDDIIIKETN